MGETCLFLHVENAQAKKGNFLDFMQDTEYQAFNFHLSDNNIKCDIVWSNKVHSEERAKDMKIFRGEKSREMDIAIHGIE